MTNNTVPFADQWFDFNHTISNWEDDFADLAVWEFVRLGCDFYDRSLEVYGADPAMRLSAEALAYCSKAGFSIVYVNHTDDWQTHYSGLNKEGYSERGWRRRAKPGGGFYISYFPQGWGASSRDDLARGYYEIVPDPLEI